VSRPGFEPPPYPYDRLDGLRAVADRAEGGCVDLSVGTPTDPPPAAALEALARSGTERGYPPSVGTLALREAAAAWLDRRLGVRIDPAALAATIGTKEFVAGAPQWLRLREPDRDTVLYPAVSYPTYAMGAVLARCRAVPVRLDADWRLDLGSVEPADAERALCLWVNSPGNPTGGVDDLAAVVAWARDRGIPVLSDECYVEFTWSGPARTVLTEGLDGVLAVHSLSKRSNLAGARCGFYAGDHDLVRYLAEVRKHAGFMVPGPVQAAAAVAYGDDDHVDAQRRRYQDRMERLAGILVGLGLDTRLPAGSFYLWVPAPTGDGWDLARRLAEQLGVLASPGEFYGEDGAGHVRLALVRPDAQLDLVARRAEQATTSV
jgi:succinyldiaminopimelate transaminase